MVTAQEELQSLQSQVKQLDVDRLSKIDELRRTNALNVGLRKRINIDFGGREETLRNRIQAIKSSIKVAREQKLTESQRVTLVSQEVSRRAKDVDIVKQTARERKARESIIKQIQRTGISQEKKLKFEEEIRRGKKLAPITRRVQKEIRALPVAPLTPFGEEREFRGSITTIPAQQLAPVFGTPSGPVFGIREFEFGQRISAGERVAFRPGTVLLGGERRVLGELTESERRDLGSNILSEIAGGSAETLRSIGQEVVVVPKGRQVPSDFFQISRTTGERVFGAGQLTGPQLLAGVEREIRETKSPALRRARAISLEVFPAFTTADPFGLRTALLASEAFAVGSFGPGGFTARDPLGSEAFRAERRRIKEEAITLSFQPGGAELKVTVPTRLREILPSRSIITGAPPVQASLLAGAGVLAGGALAQVGLAVTTVPGIAVKTAPILAQTLPLISAPILAQALTPAVGLVGERIVSAEVSKSTRLVEREIEKGIDPRIARAVGGASLGSDIIKLGALAGGFQAGLSTGLPIKFRGAFEGQVKGSLFGDIPGITGGRGVIPIVTRVQVGGITTTTKVAGIKGGFTLAPGVSKGTIFKTQFFGVSRGFTITPGTTAITPSGQIETFLFGKGTAGLAPVERAFLQSGLGVALKTQTVRSEVVNPNLFRDVKGFQALSAPQKKVFIKTLGKQRSFEIFGSSSQQVQIPGGLGRPSKDIDIRFLKATGQAKAEIFFKSLKGVPGPKITLIKPGQITVGKGVKAVKLADIHGIDNPLGAIGAVKNPFGLQASQTKLTIGTKAGNIRISSLSQEGINKLASVGSLQPSGTIGPDPIKRIKDVADFLTIQTSLAQKLSPGVKVGALGNLQVFRTTAIQKFGPGVLTSGRQLLAFGPSIGPSAGALPSLSATAGGVGILIPPSPSVRGRGRVDFLSPSARISRPSVLSSPSGISRSISASVSISPSSVISRSVSRSISRSLSPSVSPSPASLLSTTTLVPPVILPLPRPRLAGGRGRRRRAGGQLTGFQAGLTARILGITAQKAPTELPGGLGFSVLGFRPIIEPRPRRPSKKRTKKVKKVTKKRRKKKK